MNIIELIEEKALRLPHAVLQDNEALLIYGDPRFELEFPNPANAQCYVIRSKGWVGHIPVGDTIFLHVSPKAPVASIFQMLEVAYRLKSFSFSEGKIQVDTLEDLFESVVAVLARRVLDRARKGLYRAYLKRHDDLAFVRGRIDIRGNIRIVIAATPKVRCSFYELTTDIEDNQIIHWSLFAASKMGIKRAPVRQDVRRAYRALAGTVRLEPKLSHNCIGRFYHRLNSDYNELHNLCRFILEHAGPSELAGERDFVPFALNMPKLFESFVAEWLRGNLPPALRLKVQHKVKLKGDADLSFQVDLVIEDRATGITKAVLDTKYKLGEVPSEADIQQIVAYAVELGANQAVLVYPSPATRPIRIDVGPVEVRTVVFDIGADLRFAGPSFVSQLLGGNRPVPISKL
jgi:5-methylcytosine-specific restriction enzyme subunit McrC